MWNENIREKDNIEKTKWNRSMMNLPTCKDNILLFCLKPFQEIPSLLKDLNLQSNLHNKSSKPDSKMSINIFCR